MGINTQPAPEVTRAEREVNKMKETTIKKSKKTAYTKDKEQ